MEEGKYQELIQSNILDLGHHMKNDKNTRKITYKRAKRSSLSQQVTTRLKRKRIGHYDRQVRNTNNKKDHQKKHRIRMVSKKITEGFNHV